MSIMKLDNSYCESASGRPLSYMKGAGVIGLLFLLGASWIGCGQPAESRTEAAWKPELLNFEEQAPTDGRAVIQRLLEFMRSHQELVTEAFVTYQAVQESGQKLHFDLLQKIALRKPDKLYWQTLRDDASVDTAWFSDGVFRILKQPANRWGEIEAPATVAELVRTLDEDYRLNVPFHDLLVADPGDLWLGEEVTSVVYAGEAWVEGAWTDHVAVRKPGVDFELWVRKGPEPFLSKMTIAFTEADGQPTYSARFRRWATSIPETTEFVFNPPPDSEQIEVVPVSQR
jgi:hypothetical protein